MERPSAALRELGREEVHALLARNRIGRLAFTIRNQVVIEPVAYVYDDAWIYGRATPGLPVTPVEQHRFVSFEVDEMEPSSAWRAVTIRGALYFLHTGGSTREREAHDRAGELLGAAPEASPSEAAAPLLFRISAHHAVGRAFDPATV